MYRKQEMYIIPYRRAGVYSRPTNDIMYTKYGEIAYRQLFLLKERYSHLKIDNYVIMPNHIHMVLILNYETAGVTPALQ